MSQLRQGQSWRLQLTAALPLTTSLHELASTTDVGGAAIYEVRRSVDGAAYQLQAAVADDVWHLVEGWEYRYSEGSYIWHNLGSCHTRSYHDGSGIVLR